MFYIYIHKTVLQLNQRAMLRSFLRLVLVILIVIPPVACFGQSDRDSVNRLLAIMDSIYTRINNNYIQDVSLEKLTRKGINAIFDGLDPFTRYFSPEEAAEFHLNLSGKFGGTGSVFAQRHDETVFTRVFEGYPANKAGIMPGDVLIEVDGMTTKGKSLDEVRYRLIGEPGKKVSVTIKHPGSNPIKLEIVRQEIMLKSVPYSGIVRQDIGYIKFTGVSEHCSDEIRTALLELKQNKRLKGLVLDLRDNSGGYAREAIKIANYFIDKGNVIVRIKGRKEDSVIYAAENAIDKTLPLVLLTNGSTASAAEILSGAIQDNDRGLIIGQKTFGKGLIGTIYKLGGGSEAVITTSFYHTPSGRCIQSKNYWSGSAGGMELADSLRQWFNTKNGRRVREAEGIIPDITIQPWPAPGITIFLLDNMYIFDYALQYKLRHTSIPSPGDFHLTDTDYADFITAVKSKITGYTTDTEEKLKVLKTTSRSEGYFAELEPYFASIEASVNVEKMKELEKNKIPITRLLEQEIAYLYYGQKGYTEAGFKDDIELKKAIEVLSAVETYKNKLALQ
jgi:carboxyl-terminal processing protease